MTIVPEKDIASLAPEYRAEGAVYNGRNPSGFILATTVLSGKWPM
jgi:hypothetical protein